MAFRLEPNTKASSSYLYIARDLTRAFLPVSTALPRLKFDWAWPPRLSTPADSLDLLSDRNMARYRLQRRLIGPVYQASNLKRHEAAVDAVLGRIVAALRHLEGAEVDLKEWMHILVVECLGAVVLSWSPGYLGARSDRGTGRQAYIGWRKKSVFGLFPLAVLAETYSGSVGRLLRVLWGVNYETPESFRPFFPVGTTVNASLSSFLGVPPRPPASLRSK